MLDRAFALLDAFGSQVAELTLTELSESAGLPKSTTFRLAGQLVDLNILEKVDSHYRPGFRLFELGNLVPLLVRLREIAYPHLLTLHTATQQLVHFAVLDDLEVLYIERLRGPKAAPVPTRIGGREPAACTALGKAMLAYAPPAIIEQAMRTELRPRTPYSPRRATLLLDELRSIRQSGVAFDREGSYVGISCVAAPVLIQQHAVAAVSISVSSPALTSRNHSYAIRTVALSIARDVEPEWRD